MNKILCINILKSNALWWQEFLPMELFLVHWSYMCTHEHLYKGYATISGGIGFKAVAALELVSCIADMLCAPVLLKGTLYYLDTPSHIVQVCLE